MESPKAAAGQETLHPVYTPQGARVYGPMWSAVVLLFLIPPLGLFFVLSKLFREKHLYLENYLTVRKTGIVALAIGITLGVLIPLMGWDDPSAMLPLMIIFGGLPLLGGAILLPASLAAEKKGRRIYRAQKLILVDRVLKTDDLAYAMGMPYGEALRFLRQLMLDGYLPHCVIDYRAREVISHTLFRKAAKKCPHCGGTSVYLAGLPAFCAYCGRRLTR